jgi:hypothetical protein
LFYGMGIFLTYVQLKLSEENYMIGMPIALIIRIAVADYIVFAFKEVEVPVKGVTEGLVSQIVTASRGKTGTKDFLKVLNNSVPEANEIEQQSGGNIQSKQKNTARPSYVQIGSISNETPTVSHILKNNPEYSEKCWDIIFSSENRGKPFTQMREGTVVALKSGSNELVWGSMLADTAHPVQAAETDDAVNNTGVPGQEIVVGTISNENPTVSHLLHANADLNNRVWEIVHASVNNSKEFNLLRTGTQVVLNPKTMELTFHNSPAARSNTKIAETKDVDQQFVTGKMQASTLVDAVKPYIGTPYNKINCYGLIVRGLQNQGINYKGQGGIREKLIELAESHGLPRNAYFNGEGLVEKAGTKVFSKSMHNVSNASEQTNSIYSEMQPHLREGFILSFSTPTKGHTGIVSRHGDEWTYINSGLIDNNVSSGRVTRRVGEEFLEKELKNWVALAAKKKEPLTVTIGHVGQQRTTDMQG